VTRPRLLFVTQDFPPAIGGIQRYSLELAAALDPLCEAFGVLAPRAQRAQDVDAGLPFRVRRVRATSDTLPLLAAPALLSLAGRDGYTCSLHAQWATAPAALLARRAGRLQRVAIAAHGRELLLTPFRHSRTLQRRYDRLRASVLGAVDRVFAVSTYTAGLVRELGVASERVVVVPNATNAERFFPVARAAARARLGLSNAPLLLSVARLVPRKGLDTVLRALPELAARVPGVSYVIAGTGPDADRLALLARSLGVAERVRTVGHVADVDLPLWYSACDVFVMPARSEPPDVEGFGLVFLEASACERPVVGVRSGGVVDAIEHEKTGFLLPPGDVSALAGALSRLLLDPDLAAEFGRAGRARVQRDFTWQRVASRIVEELSCSP
jgi:phosphatidyl-myo-inositol dimannoside synthase